MRHSGQQWDRVYGPDLDVGKAARAKANKTTLNSEAFIEACERDGIEPTTKQASKYRRKRGKAYNI